METGNDSVAVVEKCGNLQEKSLLNNGDAALVPSADTRQQRTREALC